MDFLKRLRRNVSSSINQDRDSLWIYARCARCGEKLRARVNLFNDLSINYAEGASQDTYICRKTLVGDQQCFQRIEITLIFNASRKLIGQEITGGEFISADDNESN